MRSLLRTPRLGLPLHRPGAATSRTRMAWTSWLRWQSTESQAGLERVRNIGISAHIDSGKTTFTERVLYYTGRIRAIHEVKGKDGVGAKMDSMDLEREKGITIQSAATFCKWKNTDINIIDTPGHVDFTIEVERALRVLDGAVMVVCAVGGVQSQTITVDRQMKRYHVPRVVFINKMDRAGANPWKAIEQMREKLGLHVAAVQVPIGLEHAHQGVVDLIARKAIHFEGESGERVTTHDVPDYLQAEVEEKRAELLEALVDADDELMEALIEEREVSEGDIRAAIRRATLAQTFIPVFMGSAFKNKGVQSVLDGVEDYLPSPLEVVTQAIDVDASADAARNARREAEESDASEAVPVGQHNVFTTLDADPAKAFVGLAFKLEEGRYGQLTYVRVYQGTLKRGQTLLNTATGEQVRIQRLVRMNSNEMEEINELSAGQIGALFGVDCHSGHTFTDGSVRVSMMSMHVPEPVISLAVAVKGKGHSTQFSKALQRFQKEDPTFRVHQDAESDEMVMSGMGELHLQIYLERIKREYGVDCETGPPQVAYRETLLAPSKFDYTLKKQTGGAGQFAKVVGRLEPLEVAVTGETENQYVDSTIGGSIPPQYIPATGKGFEEACVKGPLIGQPVRGVRMVMEDGAYHPVDSSEMSFRTATMAAFREAFTSPDAEAAILEPIMLVNIVVPSEFQGSAVGLLTQRQGVITGTDLKGNDVEVTGEVPLAAMFGFATTLRGTTQGKGEFSMEYLTHRVVPRGQQAKLIEEAERARQDGKKKK